MPNTIFLLLPLPDRFVPQNIETWTMQTFFFVILVCLVVTIVVAGQAALAERSRRAQFIRQSFHRHHDPQPSLQSKQYTRVKYTKPSQQDLQPTLPKLHAK